MDDPVHQIVIEALHVVYDAERQRDEDVFARLFDRHMTRREQECARAHASDASAARARAIGEGRAGW